ncbi:MAG: heavy metal translocating P-type ATPase [Bacteroidaceae bacterium]|nr:heavy metal translocating P-type ATPase [Bacteroidaceae bacterium]
MKGQLVLIVVSALFLAAAVFIEHQYGLPTWQLLFVYLIPYLLIGHDTLKEAAEGILGGDAFNEHFLMSVATLGALAIGFMPGAETAFPEAVFVMLFFQIGELFEGYAEEKSRDSIAHLMDIRPDVAYVERDGKIESVAPESVMKGEHIVIRPGERVPLDGIVIEGTSSLNTTALTGESMPRDVFVDDEVISGCINISGLLRVRTTKEFGESTVSKIISLVENASEHKSKSEAFITRFARVYTPIVVFLALALALLPPLWLILHGAADAAYGSWPIWSTWIHRALIFLVVSCPCALVISVPLTFFGGIGGASRNGILVKGANFLDMLAKTETVVFDKTGTLTHGQFAVTAVHPSRYDAKHLLHLAAHVEHFSTHPIGAALRDAYPDEATDGCSTTDVHEIAGHGIQARVEKDLVSVGNMKMMDYVGAQPAECEHEDSGTIIHVAINGEYAGHILINDMVKADSKQAIKSLKVLGVKRIVMLTGDRQEVAKQVATELDIEEYHAELLPMDKVSVLERCLESYPSNNSPREPQTTRPETPLTISSDGCGEVDNGGRHKRQAFTAFVGDGINDAPVLARADVGIAMGGLGSDAAIEAADVVLMDDKPSKIATAISIARRTIAIANQNVVFAIGVKVGVLLLATFGLASMWMAVFADVGVTVLAVFNAMRALEVKVNV